MTRALTFISLKQLRFNKARTLLTLMGVALGVALSFAMQTANAMLADSLQQTVVRLAGKATLQVAAGDSGFPEEVLDVVRSTPGVRIAEPVIEAVARPASAGQGNILIIGVDISGNHELREYQFEDPEAAIGDTLDFISRHDSILITHTFAASHKLGDSDNLALYTSQGLKEFTIRGVIKSAGVAEILGGQVAIMDIYSAQHVFNRGRNFDRIDLITHQEETVETVRRRLIERLGPGFNVERPAMRGQQVENAAATINQGYFISGLFALLVGTFIIFNSFNIAVTQRRRDIGLLRTLGAERRHIQRMFLIEAGLIGALASFIGIICGFYLALAARAGGISSTTYQYISVPQSPTFSLKYAAVSCALGIAASLVAAWLPARAASRLDPVLALRNAETLRRGYPLKWLRVVAGVCAVGGAMALIRFTTPHVGLTLQFGYAALILFGLLIILPELSERIATLLRPVMDRAFGLEGIMAVDAMKESPRRTTATVAALMVGLGFVFSTWSFIQSQRTSVVKSFDRMMNSDLFITNHGRTYRFTEDMAVRVAAVPGIKQVESVRFASAIYRGQKVAVLALDMEAFFARVGHVLEEGDEGEARRLIPTGEGVLVAGNFSAQWGVGVGDLLRLDTPTGSLVRPILGTVNDYSAEQGTVFMERALYKQHWRDSGVDFFNISLVAGGDQDRIKIELRDLLAGEHRALIFTNAEYKDRVLKVVDRFFELTYLQMIITAAVAVIGIINTLLISVFERKREIGIIRAVGGLRSQVRKMIMLEAVAIAITGLALGGLKGFLDTYFMVRTAAAVVLGYSIPYHSPAAFIILAAPVVVAVASMAAYWPARRAMDTAVIKAIGYE